MQVAICIAVNARCNRPLTWAPGMTDEEPTSANVKLLLPPRQSRGTSPRVSGFTTPSGKFFKLRREVADRRPSRGPAFDQDDVGLRFGEGGVQVLSVGRPGNVARDERRTVAKIGQLLERSA
jgi:hypothetical protein